MKEKNLSIFYSPLNFFLAKKTSSTSLPVICYDEKVKVMNPKNCPIRVTPKEKSKGKNPSARFFQVTFLGWWKRDPFKGESWPPTFGDKKVTLNHLVGKLVYIIPKLDRIFQGFFGKKRTNPLQKIHQQPINFRWSVFRRPKKCHAAPVGPMEPQTADPPTQGTKRKVTKMLIMARRPLLNSWSFIDFFHRVEISLLKIHQTLGDKTWHSMSHSGWLK